MSFFRPVCSRRDEGDQSPATRIDEGEMEAPGRCRELLDRFDGKEGVVLNRESEKTGNALRSRQ